MPSKISRESASTLRQRRGGFTLFELLITLIVAAVLLAIAVPSMSQFVESSRLRASQSELVSALTLARSEATKRGLNVVVEAAAATPVVGKEFNEGWRVWVDADANGTYAYSAGPPTEEIVREYPATTGNVRFATTSGVTRATFNSRGFLTTGEIVFTVCGKPGVARGYRIRLEPVGIADVEERNVCT